MIDRLCRLVSTRSVSRDEATICEMLIRELSHAGLRVHRHLNNLWCEVGDAPRPRLLMNSHIDTVPPAAGWTGDPFSPRLEDGRIIGLGANDAKGCVTALVEAALRTHQRISRGERLGGTLLLALTAEEENSGKGLSEILPLLGPIDAGIVGEPTDLTPMTAQRGLLILRCVARGRTRHPANTPSDSPDNAIATAARDIAALHAFDWGAAHPLLGSCHAHVTKIQGGVALNVVPDACEFFVDIRTTPNQPHAATIEMLKERLRSEVHVHSLRLVPVDTPDNATIVRAVLRALPGSAPRGSPAMSDMVFLAGTPAVKIGPGHSPRSHTPNEFITESELTAGAAAYERIAWEYFAQAASEEARHVAGSALVG